MCSDFESQGSSDRAPRSHSFIRSASAAGVRMVQARDGLRMAADLSGVRVSVPIVNGAWTMARARHISLVVLEQRVLARGLGPGWRTVRKGAGVRAWRVLFLAQLPQSTDRLYELRSALFDSQVDSHQSAAVADRPGS